VTLVFQRKRFLPLGGFLAEPRPLTFARNVIISPRRSKWPSRRIVFAFVFISNFHLQILNSHIAFSYLS